MRRLRTTLCAVAAASLFALGGCAPQPVTHAAGYLLPVGSRSSRVRGSSAAQVFVIPWSQASGNSVLGFTKDGGAPVETITGIAQPKGLALDSAGNLYVTDAFKMAIDIFPPGATTPSQVITEKNAPQGVAVDAGGNIWVTNAFPSNGGGNLTEFGPNGALLQTRTCRGMTNYTMGLAVDAAGDVFVQGLAQATPVVEELGAGKKACKVLKVSYSGEGGGLAVTSTGDLIVADGRYSQALTYASPGFHKRTHWTFFNRPTAYIQDIAPTKDNTGIWTVSYPSTDYAVAAWGYPHAHRASVLLSITNGAIAVAADY